VTGTMTWAAMDVHARSIHAASFDVMSGELSRRVFKPGSPRSWSRRVASPGRSAPAMRPARRDTGSIEQRRGQGCSAR